MSENDYALVIGINHYPGYTSLRSACHDANSVNEWLTSSTGGGIPESQCRLLLSELNPPKPLYQHVDDEMQALFDLASQNEASRRFYFYFSGHGIGESPDDNALCMADWSRTFRIRALSSRDYMNNIVNSGYFSEVFFFLDCCRNNLLGCKGLPPSNPLLGSGDKSALCRKFIAYATDYTYPAFETNSTLGDTPLNNSYFTTALLEGLNGAAADPETGIVTPGRLKQYTTGKTSEYALRDNKQQRVEIIDGLNEDCHIIRLIPKTTRLLVRFKQQRMGHQIALIDSKLNKTEAPAGKREWLTELSKSGLYLLSDETNGDETPIKIHINEEQHEIEF